MPEGSVLTVNNSAIDCIFTRRSVRSFTSEDISLENLQTIAQAARLAPSARNSQRWKFTVLQNKSLMSRLAAVIAERTGAGDSYNFYAPNALLIASCERDFPYNREDCACALENAFLAAHALGIGSVWINQLNGICDDAPVRDMLRTLNIPDTHCVYGMAALGYASGNVRMPVKDESVIEIIS